MEWQGIYGREVGNNLAEDIKTRLKGTTNGIIHIGADSKVKSENICFIVVVAVMSGGEGSPISRLAYFKRENISDKHNEYSTKRRLLEEAYKSINVALELEPHFDFPLIIHIDANPDIKFKSSKYIKQLIGMVVGNGFDYRVKPDAWAAQTIADKLTK